MKKKMCFKRVICTFIGAGVCISFLPNIFSFNGDTHRYVTDVSLENICEINIQKSLFDENEKSYWKIISDYSLKPDEDETQGAFKYHFYNPITETNFMGEYTSALKKCVDHYNDAVKYYKDGHKQMAYQELGRALHFLEDLNTPVHTGYDFPRDAITKFPLHVRFEKICDQVRWLCRTMPELINLDYFEINTIDTIAKSCAVLSEDNFFRLTYDKHVQEENIARNAVLNAQYRVTGTLYKFFKDIK